MFGHLEGAPAIIKVLTFKVKREIRIVPRVYKGNNLSASGKISCPEDDTVAQNFLYEYKMLMQTFVA